MMKRFSFCVVITCYNKSEYISDAINSAKAEYANVIVVDDCSTDSSKEIISFFDGIDCIFLNENVGVAKATLEGVKRAINKCFDYVVLLDGDDVLAKGTSIFFSKAIVEDGYTVIYTKPSRDKLKDNRKIGVSNTVQGDIEEIKTPLRQWLKNGRATTALCARPQDIIKTYFPNITVQDHQIGYSLHKNAEKIGYATAHTHFCSIAKEENLSKNRFLVSISDIRLYNAIYEETKSIYEIKHYAKRIHRRCGKLAKFPERIGKALAFELFFRRYIFPFHSHKSIFRLTQRIINKVDILTY